MAGLALTHHATTLLTTACARVSTLCRSPGLAKRSSAHSIFDSQRCSNATRLAAWARGLSQAGRNVAKSAITETNSATAQRTYLQHTNYGAQCGVGAFSPNIGLIDGRERGCSGAARVEVCSTVTSSLLKSLTALTDSTRAGIHFPARNQ